MSIHDTDNLSAVMIVPNFPPLPTGGAETQCLRLSKKLIQRGIRVLVVTQGRYDLAKEDTVEGVAVHRHYTVLNRLWAGLAAAKNALRLRNREARRSAPAPGAGQAGPWSPGQKLGVAMLAFAFLFFLNTLAFLWRRRRDFQVIHVHTIEWAAIIGAVLGKLLGKKVLVKDSTMNGVANLRRYPFGWRLQRLVINQCTFVAMTRAIEENFLAGGVAPGRIVRIPNGIDVPDLPPRTPPSGHTCLFVGNLYQQPAKGFDVLLNAWPLVIRRFPGAVLHVAGDGNLDRYRAEAVRCGVGTSVVFHGRVQNLKDMYLSADVFVLPSRREGMSNALLEAMAHALPCVATDISGSQDLIENGVSGLLVPVEDAAQLAKGILFLFDHPETAREMGLHGRKSLEGKLDLNLVAEKYIQVYRRIIGLPDSGKKGLTGSGQDI
jgi:L-malate glycosyltransferase